MDQKKAYNILIYYLCNVTNQSKTTLELSIKDMLITCKSNISKKLDRNGLTVENADNIIHYVKEEALKSKDCNKRILFEMIKDFIESVTLDHYIASGVLEKHTHLIEKQISDSKIVPIKNQDVITNYHNNNRLGIKRETVYSEIQKCKSYNVIVLHGPKHSGKSMVKVLMYASCIGELIFKTALFLPILFAILPESIQVASQFQKWKTI